MKRILWVGLLLGLCAVFLASCGKQEASNPGGASNEETATAFVDLVAAGNFASAANYFDARMASALPPNKLQESWNGLTNALGPFKGRGGVRTAKEQGYDVVYVTCEFERDSMEAKVVLGRAGKVSGLWFVKPEGQP